MARLEVFLTGGWYRIGRDLTMYIEKYRQGIQKKLKSDYPTDKEHGKTSLRCTYEVLPTAS